MFDVVTLGEAMLRLSPPDFLRLEQTDKFDCRPGGAELNVAVACARLGLKSCWASRLPNHALGWMIRNKAREHGVSDEGIVWGGSGERVGVYYMEFGASPRASKVLYDRGGAAVTRLKPGDVDWDKLFDGSRHFHTTGITPALSESCAAVTREAMEAAKRHGLSVSYDLNYRSKLWKPDVACAMQEPLMELVDILITTEEDTKVVFGIEAEGGDSETFTSVDAASYGQVAKKLADRFGFSTVAITLRENPSVWFNSWSAIAYHEGQFLTDVKRDVEIVDRVGGGDSFAGGFIYGLLTGDVSYGLRFGNAFSAIKHSIPGDFAWITRDEVEAVMSGAGLRVQR
ncbi:MAG: sugar kinase [Armatimonadetes bacterium]|nr:sugar kinase [Armatimonadota bacterium]